MRFVLFGEVGTKYQLVLLSLCPLLALGCSGRVSSGAAGTTAVSSPNSTASVSAPPSVVATVTSANQVSVQWSDVAGSSSYQIQVDDTPYFRQPIVNQAVNTTTFNLNPLEAGLTSGVTYYVQVYPGNAQTTFRLPTPAWPESYLNYSYARSAWNNSGRLWMAEYSGISWDAASSTWQLDSSWPDAGTNVAQDAYDLEYAARGAVNMGAVRGDLPLLDELASFYVNYENRFTTLGAMRAMVQYNTSLLPASDPDSTQTLIWIQSGNGTSYVQECDLCNSQFYYPVARLLRVITTLPESQRTPAMLNFAQWYGPVLANDHLLRLFTRNQGQLISQIRDTLGGLDDEGLWLGAAAAELLGANANDPGLVPLTPSEILILQQDISIIVQTLQSQYRSYDTGTNNFQGQTVGSVSYFNGMFQYQDPADYAFSGYGAQSFPTSQDAAVQPSASWDISHSYRFPVFLRALYDNRKATGNSFPGENEIQLLTNQLVYKNFQGNMDKPLFNNFFDGGNGWYRVGYHGANFGYPPAQYCNSNSSVGQYSLPCLTSGAVQGWGLVAFFNPDLAELEHSLSKLAWTTDATHQAFLKQYYYYAGQDFSAIDSQSQPQYPILLYFILSNSADKLN